MCWVSFSNQKPKRHLISSDDTTHNKSSRGPNNMTDESVKRRKIEQETSTLHNRQYEQRRWGIGSVPKKRRYAWFSASFEVTHGRMFYCPSPKFSGGGDSFSRFGIQKEKYPKKVSLLLPTVDCRNSRRRPRTIRCCERNAVVAKQWNRKWEIGWLFVQK